jgi:hypothetical protein
MAQPSEVETHLPQVYEINQGNSSIASPDATYASFSRAQVRTLTCIFSLFLSTGLSLYLLQVPEVCLLERAVCQDYYRLIDSRTVDGSSGQLM